MRNPQEDLSSLLEVVHSGSAVPAAQSRDCEEDAEGDGENGKRDCVLVELLIAGSFIPEAAQIEEFESI
jgi:hypothetical protein